MIVNKYIYILMRKNVHPPEHESFSNVMSCEHVTHCHKILIMSAGKTSRWGAG